MSKKRGYTTFEKMLGVVSPRAAMQRAYGRECMYRYEAAQNTGRERASTPIDRDPESLTNSLDRYKVLKEARNLAENFAVFRGVLVKYVTYAVGNLKYQARTNNRQRNRKIENAFNAWAAHADVTGRNDLTSMIEQAVMSWLTDGDHGFVWVKGSKGLQLQAIEADRIGNPLNPSKISKDYVQGIRLDGFGSPEEYEIYKRDRQGFNFELEKVVPASEFMLFVIPSRASEYRGVSPLASVINTAKDIHEILKAEKLGVKTNSQHAAIVFNEQGAATPTDILNGADPLSKNAAGNDISEIETNNGQFWFMKNTDRVQPMIGSRPSVTFDGFIQSLVREIATAVNMPYGVLYDLSSLTGPGARTELALAQREFERIQRHLTTRILDPIKKRILFYLAATDESLGEDPLDESLYLGKWQFPAKLTIDAGRESKAAIDEVRAGMRSRADWFSDNAEDPEEQIAQIEMESSELIKSANRLSVENDIPFEVAYRTLGGEKLDIKQDTAVIEASPQAGEFAQYQESYKPTQAMAENARRALEVREEKPESQRGMTDVGLARARDIMNRRNLSFDTVKRMKAYFDRHEIDKQGETWDEQGKGWQAWNGWGGDEGRTWANNIVDKEDD